MIRVHMKHVEIHAVNALPKPGGIIKGDRHSDDIARHITNILRNRAFMQIAPELGNLNKRDITPDLSLFLDIRCMPPYCQDKAGFLFSVLLPDGAPGAKIAAWKNNINGQYGLMFYDMLRQHLGNFRREFTYDCCFSSPGPIKLVAEEWASPDHPKRGILRNLKAIYLKVYCAEGEKQTGKNNNILYSIELGIAGAIGKLLPNDYQDVEVIANNY